MNRELKVHLTNKLATPNVGISIYHAGRNWWIVALDGIGDHSQYTQLGTAFASAHRLSNLGQDDLNWEIATIQSRNTQKRA